MSWSFLQKAQHDINHRSLYYYWRGSTVMFITAIFGWRWPLIHPAMRLLTRDQLAALMKMLQE
jgi:hypothetical protein